MKKPTVAKLAEAIERLEYEKGDVLLTQAVVYHWEQIAAEIEKCDRYGELVKVEITHSFVPGKKSYLLMILHRPFLNPEKRARLGGNYYSGLEASADRYFPKKK